MSIVKATFEVDGKPSEALPVHFNPVTLKLTSTNQIADKSGAAHQASAKTATKLDLELVFDSTETGGDVRLDSNRLRRMGQVLKANETLPKVVFRWGGFVFVGSIETLNETFDYFSEAGVPLRVTVQVAMKGLRLEEPKPQAGGNRKAVGAAAPADGRGATGLAQSLGDPRAGRAVAASAGMESMRFPGANVSVSLEPTLLGPAGLSADAGAGLSLDAGFGASASAGVARGAGAFAGLRAGVAGAASPGLAGAGLNGKGIGVAAGASLPAAATFDLTGRVAARPSLDLNLSTDAS